MTCLASHDAFWSNPPIAAKLLTFDPFITNLRESLLMTKPLCGCPGCRNPADYCVEEKPRVEEGFYRREVRPGEKKYYCEQHAPRGAVRLPREQRNT